MIGPAVTQPHTMKKNTAGFTLVEIAIVLVIVGLIIGGMLTPLQMQLEQRRISDTQRSLDEARESLMGFALQNGYLPCPAISASNGLEDRSGTACTNNRRSGFLPWATLGLNKLDSWNHLYRYSVTPAFAVSGNLFSLKTPRDITLATRDGNGQLTPAAGIADTVAVIMSHGKNGYGGYGEQGNAIPNSGSGNIDEQSNWGDTGRAFVTRPQSDNPKAPGGEFDDLVSWVSPHILFSRMVAAQRLP
jgi:prepilin-type N-terminal cleavage/methylation domain-containing protein